MAATSAPARPTFDGKSPILLPVPYFSQRDSVTGQGDRMCYSSTCAMAVKYLRPAALLGSNADDAYLHTVRRYGDTTSPQAQIRACADYGVLARFSTRGDRALLERELRSGYPLATGFLHHGPSSAPRGGGHWILSVGLAPGFCLFNDPYGELDLTNGGWSHQGQGSGRNQHYSFANTNPRWLAEGANSGWAWIFSR
jgi:hypothetical protein